MAPHPDSVAAVNYWLQFHNIDPMDSVHRSGGGDWITLRIPVGLAEQMLGTKYNVYRHPTSGQEVVRTLSYSLPRELHDHIDMIAPTTYFGTLRSMKVTSFLQPKLDAIMHDITPASGSTLAPSCNVIITPACLRALYNTSDYVPVSMTTNKLAAAGYLNEFANYADLEVGNLFQEQFSITKSTYEQIFLTKYRSDAIGSTFTTVQVNHGGNDQLKPGSEVCYEVMMRY